MNETKGDSKKRLFYLDFIKVVACWAVFTIHFNAHTSGIFTIQRYIFPNHIFRGVYLGTFGVSLFFMASGAGLYYSWIKEKKHSILKFYYKRAAALYPMFWIAYVWAAIVCLLVFKKFSSAEIKYFPLTVIGADGYLQGLDIITGKFYLVGEWFLGCIFLMYIVAPILLAGVQRYPLVTILCTMLISISCKLPGLPAYFSSDLWVLRRLPEFVLGMLVIRYLTDFSIKIPIVGTALFAFGLCISEHIPDKVMYDTLISFSWFLILIGISEIIKDDITRKMVITVSKYSYAVFLTHDFIIYSMASFFDLGSLQRRDLIILYITVILFTAFWARIIFMAEKMLKEYCGIYISSIKRNVKS